MTANERKQLAEINHEDPALSSSELCSSSHREGGAASFPSDLI